MREAKPSAPARCRKASTRWVSPPRNARRRARGSGGHFWRAGHHGDMAWMERTAERRADPQALWPDAKSVITLGVNYAPAADPLAGCSARERGVISVYAQGADYHDVVKAKLKRLASWIAQELWRRCEDVRRYRAGDGKAAGAGRGHWAGRASTPISSRANSARGCFWARFSPRWSCRPTRRRPTTAAPARAVSTSARPTRSRRPISIDARRCISYLTIEHKGHIAREFRRRDGQSHLWL